METMDLWNKVCETDPAITKKVNQRGGFTAICAQAQLKKATELWGPYGGNWYIADQAYNYIRDASSEIIEVALSGTFKAPGVTFQLSADMTYKAGNDTCKKLLTDLTTKALSKIGFNSDVFEGRFDDNKYVAAMEAKFNGNGAPDLITDEQAVKLALRLDKIGGDLKKFLENFKVERLEDIPQSQYDKADRMIAAKEPV